MDLSWEKVLQDIARKGTLHCYSTEASEADFLIGFQILRAVG